MKETENLPSRKGKAGLFPRRKEPRPRVRRPRQDACVGHLCSTTSHSTSLASDLWSLKTEGPGPVFGAAQEPLDGTPTSYKGVPGLEWSPALHSSFLLMPILGGSSDGSGSWVLATYISDSKFLAPSFSLLQFQSLQASGREPADTRDMREVGSWLRIGSHTSPSCQSNDPFPRRYSPYLGPWEPYHVSTLLFKLVRSLAT